MIIQVSIVIYFWYENCFTCSWESQALSSFIPWLSNFLVHTSKGVCALKIGLRPFRLAWDLAFPAIAQQLVNEKTINLFKAWKKKSSWWWLWRLEQRLDFILFNSFLFFFEQRLDNKNKNAERSWLSQPIIPYQQTIRWMV